MPTLEASRIARAELEQAIKGLIQGYEKDHGIVRSIEVQDAGPDGEDITVSVLVVLPCCSSFCRSSSPYYSLGAMNEVLSGEGVGDERRAVEGKGVGAYPDN